MNRRTLELLIQAKNAAGPALKAVGTALKGMGTRGKKAAKILNVAFKALKKTVKAFASVAKAAFKSLLIPLAALALGFGLSIRTAAQFEQSMANVQSVLSGTAAEMKMVSTAAREMGKTSVFTASEAANALYDLASAGFDAEQAVSALRGTMLLAAATNSDLTFTTETVTATVKQFGLQAQDADRIANTFAASISFSKLNMDRLSTAMAFAGPVAGAFGHSLEGTLSVLAQFANLGLRASMIGTTFRMGLLQLSKAMPIEDIENGADVLKRLNIQFKDIDPSMNSVADIVGRLQGKIKTMGDATALFGTRAAGPFFKLIQAGAGPLREFEKRITGTRKAFQMSEIQIATFLGRLRLFKSAVQEVQISLGSAFLPALIKIVDQFASWTRIIGQVDFSTFWQAFKTGTDVGVGAVDNIIDLFREGGAFRQAISAWGFWFIDVVSDIASVIWRPIETELQVILMRLQRKIHETLPGWMVSGSRSDAQGQFSENRISAFRLQQQKRLSGDFQRLMRTAGAGTRAPVARTTEALEAFAGSLQIGGGGGMGAAAEGQQQAMQSYVTEVTGSLQKTQSVMEETTSQLNEETARVKAQQNDFEAKMKMGMTNATVEVGTVQ